MLIMTFRLPTAARLFRTTLCPGNAKNTWNDTKREVTIPDGPDAVGERLP